MAAVELPAIPHTVIRVAWLPDAFQEDAGDVLLLEENGYWRSKKGLHLPDMLVNDITGFQTLAVPPAETARELLNRRHELYMEGAEFLDEILADEYGVELDH